MFSTSTWCNLKIVDFEDGFEHWIVCTLWVGQNNWTKAISREFYMSTFICFKRFLEGSRHLQALANDPKGCRKHRKSRFRLVFMNFHWILGYGPARTLNKGDFAWISHGRPSLISSDSWGCSGYLQMLANGEKECRKYWKSIFGLIFMHFQRNWGWGQIRRSEKVWFCGNLTSSSFTDLAMSHEGVGMGHAAKTSESVIFSTCSTNFHRN